MTQTPEQIARRRALQNSLPIEMPRRYCGQCDAFRKYDPCEECGNSTS